MTNFENLQIPFKKTAKYPSFMQSMKLISRTGYDEGYRGVYWSQ